VIVKFFWKQYCPKCPAAKAIIADLENVEYYNLDETDGLAEAAFYGIMSTPSVVITKPNGSEVTAFRGTVPTSEVLRQWL